MQRYRALQLLGRWGLINASSTLHGHHASTASAGSARLGASARLRVPDMLHGWRATAAGRLLPWLDVIS